jgi:ribosomal protein S18 acetylase RimI-like enzyme
MAFVFDIKLCRADEAPRIAPLIQALAVEEGADPAEVDEIQTIVEALIQSGASDFLLALVDDRPVGCMQIAYRLSTWQAQPYAYIEDFYLAPQVRGRGVGTKLLDYALQRAEGQGSDKIVLDVRAANSAAQRLYARFGFSDNGSIILQRPLPLGESYCDTTTTLAAIEELRGGDSTTEPR